MICVICSAFETNHTLLSHESSKHSKAVLNSMRDADASQWSGGQCFVLGKSVEWLSIALLFACLPKYNSILNNRLCLRSVANTNGEASS